MKASPEVEAAVLETLKDSWDAYRRQETDEVLSYYTVDDDLVAIGTGADERFTGRESLRAGLLRDFSQGHEAKLVITWASVSQSGNVAWIAAQCVTEVNLGCQTAKIPARLTAVMEQRGERWCIMQTHFSLPGGAAAPTVRSCEKGW
ncbi:MAG TPA: nuclear transport factor 2 family protein [Syntrophorhabdaceae bacterium]|jgi:ketosteroid isomerase-like protein